MTEIVVLSGKGGTGKTSLSAALATLGERVVVADCDVDAANLWLILQPDNFRQERFVTGHKAVIDHEKCSNCGLCQEYCRFGAIGRTDGLVTIQETSCDGCKLCARICPIQAISMIASDQSRWFIGEYRNGKMVHARLAPGEENSGKLVNVVREQARIKAREEEIVTVIIDGPPGTGCPVISSVTGADKVIIVTEPTGTGFHDLKRIIELVSNFKIRPYVVVNKYDLNSLVTDQIIDWCQAAGIAVVGKLAFDEAVVEAMVHCKSIAEWQPESETTREIKRIWNIVNSE